MLPVQLEQNNAIDAVIASMLPWQTPACWPYMVMLKLVQVVHCSPLCYEWPISWLRTTEAIGQFNLEWLCLQRYRTDHTFGQPDCALLRCVKG